MKPTLSISDRFALELTDSLLDLNRVSVVTRARIASLMQQLGGDLVRAVRNADIGDAVSLAGRVRRAEQAIRAAERAIRTRFKAIAKRLSTGAGDIATNAGKDAAAAMAKTFGKGSVRPLSKTALRTISRDELVLGETMQDWLAAQQEQLRRTVARELRMAARRKSETSEETMFRIRGTPTGRTIEVTLAEGRKKRVREYRGGIIDTPINQADALVRTAMHAVTQSVWLATVAQGDEVIGFAAVTVLDDRTSRICIARTGARWFTSGEPMPGSTRDEPFPGSPPWHWHCRSSLIPLTSASSERLRITTFDDWLAARGEAFARKKLGPGLFDLWKAGRITLSQLIDHAGNPLTLKELARR